MDDRPRTADLSADERRRLADYDRRALTTAGALTLTDQEIEDYVGLADRADPESAAEFAAGWDAAHAASEQEG